MMISASSYTINGNGPLNGQKHGKKIEQTKAPQPRTYFMKANLATQLLVVGGGATGLGVAWDASLRGIKTVLIEQSDLGQGTSGRYHGLLHSGGRYVISDPQSARECAQENQILRQIAPSTIEPTGGFFLSTPADPSDFSDEWLAAAQSLGLPVEELTISQALNLEPKINPKIKRAFAVEDASLDSFDLLHDLAASIREAGGEVWLRHKLEALEISNSGVTGAVIRDLTTGRKFTLGVEAVVNAAGPWAAKVAQLAEIDLPIALGKGVMVALAMRPIQHVLNRCKPPADGDIIVPVGTVAVVGTTDVEVEEPTSLQMEPWEIDLILAEGDILVPGILNQRPLRAWAGIRPLYQPRSSTTADTRTMTRAHIIIDHGADHDCKGLFSVFGGKLTTFRLMAQETVDVVSQYFGVQAECSTATTALIPADSKRFYQLSERPSKVASIEAEQPAQQVLCECELVTYADVERMLAVDPDASLDDLRRDLRLGMGPCQGGFCSYRAAGLAHRLNPTAPQPYYLTNFLHERWKGIKPLAWGNNLRQMELSRRIYQGIFAVDTVGVDRA
jgi:glycerol-3-phosphate dehydrogenase